MQAHAPDFTRLARLYEQEKARFTAFYDLLLAYNAKFNLTALTEEREVYFKHFLDSMAGEEELLRGTHVAEVGSGAGFPSIPLMLIRPDLRFTLIESTGKKCDFLRTAVRELGLAAEVRNIRAEDAGKDPAMREFFGAVVARAVARLDTLAEYCMPLVKRGGVFLAYKGSDSELSSGGHALKVLGGGTPRVISYELPQSFGSRNLVVTQKIHATPAQYPRGNGAERRNPIL